MHKSGDRQGLYFKLDSTTLALPTMSAQGRMKLQVDGRTVGERPFAYRLESNEIAIDDPAGMTAWVSSQVSYFSQMKLELEMPDIPVALTSAEGIAALNASLMADGQAVATGADSEVVERRTTCSRDRTQRCLEP